MQKSMKGFFFSKEQSIENLNSNKKGGKGSIKKSLKKSATGYPQKINVNAKSYILFKKVLKNK